jgi:uncharacterized protein
MEIQLDKQPAGYYVNSFNDNEIVIGEICYTSSLVVAPTHVIPDWSPQHSDEIQMNDFDVILDLQPELVLVGTGNGLRFPNSAIYKRIIDAGLGIDFMDSRAVCRTYNILAAEGRHVVAGVIINQSASET